jgi:hypothetical protein
LGLETEAISVAPRTLKELYRGTMYLRGELPTPETLRLPKENRSQELIIVPFSEDSSN